MGIAEQLRAAGQPGQPYEGSDAADVSDDDWVASAVDLDARLHLVATWLVWGKGGWVDDAIDLACSLVVAERGTPATAAVCALSPGATVADAEHLVRAMLDEQGLPEPPPHPTDEERFAYLDRAFGLGTIPFHDFYGNYYGRGTPTWDEQSVVQQRMLRLLDDWETTNDEERRAMLVAAMRAAITNADDAST